jgi:uncharacterized protein YdcH (DUF465 family)
MTEPIANQSPTPGNAGRRWAVRAGSAPRPVCTPDDAPCRYRPGRLHVRRRNSMFEGQPQAELDKLIKGHPEFKQLYQRHKELDKKVLDAELGVLPIDETTLTQMKREKLAAKDRLTRLYDVLQH